MKLIRCFAVIFLIAMLTLLSPHGRGAELNIAPFARRCCVEDRLTTQTEFSYVEAQHAPRDAERTSDGRYVYGL